MKKRILVIDDDDDLNISISLLLKSEGFDVIGAKNGKIALDYLNSFSDRELPDLVILDYEMPHMNAKEFCRIKATIRRYANLPVLLITDGGRLVNVMDTCNTEAYMAKPLDIEMFLLMVRHFSHYSQLCSRS